MVKNIYGIGNFVLFNIGYECVVSWYGFIMMVCY